MTRATYAIFGPTGSGKTEVAVELAARLKTEVVNCDPAQCYAGYPILSNQPTAEHDEVAKHRMIAVWPLNFEASFVDFAKRAHQEIDELHQTRGSAVACGGSGLYLQAALTDLITNEERQIASRNDRQIRIDLEKEYANPGGAERLHQELKRLDAEVAKRIHKNDRTRLVRALEVARSGESISPKGASMWDATLNHSTIIIGLKVDRSILRERIDRRTKTMFATGVLDEVAKNLEKKHSHTALKLHGLSDCRGLLSGEHDEQTAQNLMATRTRQYAKRQDTWARRWPNLIRIEATNRSVESIVDEVLAIKR